MARRAVAIVSEHRVSRTSQLIAAALLYAATRPELAGHVPDEDLELLRERLPRCSAYVRRLVLLSRPGVRGFSRVVERLLLPGIVAHYVIRKVILRQCVERAVREEGLQQVVILGAGLDLLGRRVARNFPGVAVIETDRAESIAMKSRLLGSSRPQNLLLHPHELDSAPVDEALRTVQGFEKDRATLVLAEGMLMYCPVEDVRRLLIASRELFIHPLRLVFTYMEDNPSGRVQFRNQNRLVTWWLARSGEPFRWGMPDGAMVHFLRGAGFALERAVRSAEFAAEHHLLPAKITPPASGEVIAVAESR